MSSTDTKIEFYVAPDGKDTNPGALEAPFATLRRARDAVRKLKKTAGEKGLLNPVTVLVRGGKYFLKETLVLTDVDSGTRACPITWCAYPGEKPILSGGRIITGWRSYQNGILQAEFPGRPDRNWQSRQLFLNGERLQRSRWPKVDATNQLYSGWAQMEGPAEEGSRTAFRYKAGTFPRSWKKPTMGEVTYFFYYEWGNITAPIRSVDEESRIITLSSEGYQFDGWPWYVEGKKWQTFRPGNRFCVENMLEDLTAPGEWCYDRHEETFYLRPPEGPDLNGQVVVPVLDRILDLWGTNWVNIRGFTFTETTDGDDLNPMNADGCGAMRARGLRYAGDALRLCHARHCSIKDNTFCAVGGNAIYLMGNSEHNLIGRNEIHRMGTSGVALAGTIMKHPRFNDIADNYIHHGCLFNKYGAGVFLGLSDGNYIRHNRIEYLPHHAINLADNHAGRNIVEFNELRHVCQECHDNGAINSWMERTPLDGERCGHVIRYNLIADSYSYKLEDGKLVKQWAFGIYLDNYSSNCFVYGNIILRATWAGVLVHGGKNNVIENNIIVDCGANFRFQNIVASWLYWKEKGFENFMTSNHFCRNICYQSDPKAKVVSLHLWTDRVLAQCDDNVVFQTGKGKYTVEHDDNVPDDQKIKTFDQWRNLGYDEHSLIADPLFVDPAHDNYRLKPDSPALKLGFQPIPFDRIGVRRRL